MPPCGGHPASASSAGCSLVFQVVPPCGGPLISTDSFYDATTFQVVPPCGGHPDGSQGENPPEEVSSRAPVWGASIICDGSIRSGKFQVVPPCGGHLASGATSYTQAGFKSCPRVGGIVGKGRGPCLPHVCFKSCPRVGGIPISIEVDGRVIVSSRAPVWGASGVPRAAVAVDNVSSRAPVWGASSSSAFDDW